MYKKIVFSLLTVFERFFSQIRTFPDRIRIFGLSGSGLRKKSLIRIRTKGHGSETLILMRKLIKFKTKNSDNIYLYNRKPIPLDC